MSGSTLPVLTHPSFPQVFAAAITQEVNRAVAQPLLSTCCREFPESRWGAGDAVACTRKATIYDLETEQEYCFPCYREVRRG